MQLSTFQPRRAINRYFGLTERTSRKLSFVSTITIMASSVAEGDKRVSKVISNLGLWYYKFGEIPHYPLQIGSQIPSFGLPMLLPRTLYQASEIERAGRTYLLAYRQLNSMSSSMNDLAWVLTPKWHVSWWCSINLSLSSLTFGNFIFGIPHNIFVESDWHECGGILPRMCWCETPATQSTFHPYICRWRSNVPIEEMGQEEHW